MQIRIFSTLRAWKKSRKVKFFHKSIVPALSKEGLYDLRSQIRRAAISITANITKGCGRFCYQEGIQFYRISRASVYELKDHLITCLDLNNIGKELLGKGISLIKEAKKMLNRYIYILKIRKKVMISLINNFLITNPIYFYT